MQITEYGNRIDFHNNVQNPHLTNTDSVSFSINKFRFECGIRMAPGYSNADSVYAAALWTCGGYKDPAYLY